MPRIILNTLIEASPEICFDLSRSVDLHLLSTAKTREKVLYGKTSGLMELNEEVTWRALHLGVWQNLTSRITEFEYPMRFVSEMQKGAFQKLHHQHIFQKEETATLMTDVFDFEAPLGLAGRLFCRLFLTAYMQGFLEERNRLIKQEAENPTCIFLKQQL
ncbi:MAG TPA: SRPBCC family protein [Bacteroidia bacterium]|jgi:ligand-binding SRPBCC domain-containing protein|nr:SRPBCC family protein [Bacteroidia bacterium]